MPKTLSKSHSAQAFRSGASKLWILLVGVNHYEDENLPSLRFPAPDCQGLGQALQEATQAFPRRELCIHQDFSEPLPTLEQVRQSLKRMTADAQPQDTILFYFSGHGIIDSASGQAVLCLRDTCKDYLLESGLSLPEILSLLGQSLARQQLVWLDACHSGGMTLWGAKNAKSEDLIDPTPQLMAVLRQRAAQGRGFYALLSCDHDQRSWEFPELGHGVFTYYLMRGLRGEAADDQGVVDADGLYKYVYHQTLRYIDKANQQIRLVNSQKRSKGDANVQAEYPLQTPKRIVEGMGELILGLQAQFVNLQPPRRALIVDGLTTHQSTLALSKVLQGDGQFSLEYWPKPGAEWENVRDAIQTCLQAGEDLTSRDLSTVLLYLRGRIESGDSGEAWLVVGDGVRLSRSWLRRLLRRAGKSQQVVILDFPGAAGLSEWVEDLQGDGERGQCLIAAAALDIEPEQFTQALLATLQTADRHAGLPVAAWISQLQVQLAGTPLALASQDVVPLSWLSGVQGVIEVLPSTVGRSARDRTDQIDLGVCPYLGLRPFGEDQAQYFYGRQELVQGLINSLGQQSVIAVVGASGSGKSSIVQAGLMAQLRCGKQLPGSEHWWMRAMRPGPTPLKALAQRLVDAGTERERAYQQLQIEGLLHLGAEGLVQWLRSRPEPMVVLVIDQFEELFTLATPHDRQIWLNLVLGALEYAADRFKLVITLRADFVTPCLEYPALAQILKQSSRYIPPYLSPEDYHQVILQPAEQVGLQVEPGLIELLLQDLTQTSGELPLLEFVLEKLWEQRQSGQLTVTSYQQMGGVRGALEQHAQAVYNSLEVTAKDCARWIFLSLTQLGEGTEDTRRRVPKSALTVAKYSPELMEETLRILTAASLVVVNTEETLALPQSRSLPQNDANPSPEISTDIPPDILPLPPPEPTFEVVHEILIRHWSTLQWWLAENRARLQIQRQVEQLASLWHRHGRQADDLLRGQRLAEAEDLYIHHTDELSQPVQEFIEAALGVRQQQQQQLQRQLRRSQIIAAIIGGLGLVALGLAGAAYRQKVLAQMETIHAVASSSEALLWSNQQLEALTASVQAAQDWQRVGPLGKWLVGKEAQRQTQWHTAGTLQQALTLTTELNRFNGHTQAVNTVRFSPDGQRLASASNDGTVRLWRRDGRLLAVMVEPADPAQTRMPVTDVAFSPDGQTLAVADAGGTIWHWQLQADEPVLTKTLLRHQKWLTSLAFSPDGQYLAAASRDGTVQLINLETITHQSITGHSGWVNQVSFSPDGQTLITAGEDRTVRLWSLGGEPLKTLVGHQDRATSARFSPDGQTLASASADGTVHLWAAATGEVLQVLNRSEGNQSNQQINDVSFSPTGESLAAAQSDGQIHFWQLDDFSHHALVGHQGEVLSVQFSPVHESADQDRGLTLASASADETIRLWQPAPVEQLSPHGIYSVAVRPTFPNDPNGLTPAPLFAVAGWDGTITLWQPNPNHLANLVTVLEGSQTPIEALAFSPDGTMLAAAGSDPQILLWRVSDGTQVARLEGNTERITALAWHPDGSLLASAGEGADIKLWALEPTPTGLVTTPTSFPTDHSQGMTSLSFSPDGKVLVSGSYDHTVKLWHLRSGPQPVLARLDTLTDHSAAVATVQFSPNGQLLATGSWDNTIQLWRMQGKASETIATAEKILTGHVGGVTSLAFTPDSAGLLSSGSNGVLHVWDGKSGELVKTLWGHRGSVRSVAISPRGDWFISGEDNGGVLVWDFDLQSLLRQGCSQLQPYLSTNTTLSQVNRQLCDR